ncbi:soma ferritin [Anopheles moucheti]|uniref:soma ferritin n=1 Tax=Anopheles moucheti TaxID=186751 RepID=UPI0022F075EF|nr:soma ferritin [Anopheles moucheti]
MIAKMKLVFILGFVLVASAFAKGNECENEISLCSPKYSSFLNDPFKNDLKNYTTQLVDKSFQFLILSSSFNQHSLDRPGFEKLYRKISDKAWEDAIELIKYQSRRGGFGHLVDQSVNKDYTKVLDTDELTSLKFALNYEKAMAKEAHAIHRKISHVHSKSNEDDDSRHYDPDTAHYLDEKIIEYQSGVIRDLAGYIHNLQHFTKCDKRTDNSRPVKAHDLGVHVFDEYLAKVY